MQNVQKRNLQLCMQNVRQNVRPFFVFEMLIYFYVNVSRNFVIRE